MIPTGGAREPCLVDSVGSGWPKGSGLWTLLAVVLMGASARLGRLSVGSVVLIGVSVSRAGMSDWSAGPTSPSSSSSPSSSEP